MVVGVMDVFIVILFSTLLLGTTQTARRNYDNSNATWQGKINAREMY